MSSSTTLGLGELPTELVKQIFESSDQLTAVAALSSTCSNFHGHLKANIPGIRDSVLGQQIEGFRQAQELLNTQIKQSANPEERDTGTVAQDRAKRYFQMAKTAQHVFNYYQENTIKGVKKNDYRGTGFDKNEREDIIRAYYRVSAFIVAERRSETRPIERLILKSVNLLEFKQMEWVVLFMNKRTEDFGDGNYDPNVVKLILDTEIGDHTDWERQVHLFEELRKALKAGSGHTILDATARETLLKPTLKPERTGADEMVKDIIPRLDPRGRFRWLFKEN